MRTIEQYKAENEAIREPLLKDGRIVHFKDEEKQKVQQKLINKADKQIQYNNACIGVLEQGLDQERLQKQLDALETRLKLVLEEDRIATWIKNTVCTWNCKNIDQYYKVFNVSAMKAQIKFLKYMLNG